MKVKYFERIFFFRPDLSNMILQFLRKVNKFLFNFIVIIVTIEHFWLRLFFFTNLICFKIITV